jgi:aldehyde reductase
VSNFGVQHLEGLKAARCPTPSVNQIELHVFFQQKEIVDYCHAQNIAVMGYSPLAKAKQGFENEVLTAIANK